MSVRANPSEVKERTEFVIDLLKEAKGELVSGIDLQKSLQMEPKAFYSFIQRLKKKYPDRIGSRNRKHGDAVSGYYWIFDVEPVMEEKAVTEVKEEKPVDIAKTDRYDDRFNDEGYSDPTANAGMRNAGKLNEINPGEIWAVQNPNKGDDLEYVVLAAFNSSISCLPMYREGIVLNSYEKPQCKTFKIKDESVLVNVVKVCTKPGCYFKRKIGEVSKNQLSLIRAFLGKHLGIEGIGVKVIEKKVKVEVPVPVETPTATVKGYTYSEVEEFVKRAIIEERARIYEDVFNKLVGRNAG